MGIKIPEARNRQQGGWGKHQAYREAREVRLIFTPDAHAAAPSDLPSDGAVVDRRYFGMVSEIRDYYALIFSESVWPKLVRCITIGPKNRTHESIIRDMLDKLGLVITVASYSGANYK